MKLKCDGCGVVQEVEYDESQAHRIRGALCPPCRKRPEKAGPWREPGFQYDLAKPIGERIPSS